MQLLQHRLQFCRDRQTEISRVLNQGKSLVGQVEEDHRCPQDAPRANDVGVQSVADAYQAENEYLFEDALKAHGRGQFLVHNGAHHTRDIVKYRKAQKRIE